MMKKARILVCALVLLFAFSCGMVALAVGNANAQPALTVVVQNGTLVCNAIGTSETQSIEITTILQQTTPVGTPAISRQTHKTSKATLTVQQPQPQNATKADTLETVAVFTMQDGTQQCLRHTLHL